MQFSVVTRIKLPGYALPGMEVLKAEGFKVGAAPRCEACGRYIGPLVWMRPYRVELKIWNSRDFGDMALTGVDLVVSLRFKEAWGRSGLVGLGGFEPVEVVKVRSRKKGFGGAPPYLRATIARSRTAVDQIASGFEWDGPPTCPECLLGYIQKRWKRVVIDQSTWTGEDVFFARGSSSDVMVSERFREFCDRNEISNCVLVPAEFYAYDFYPWEHCTSGTT
jgi:hypothetical protein